MKSLMYFFGPYTKSQTGENLYATTIQKAQAEKEVQKKKAQTLMKRKTMVDH